MADTNPYEEFNQKIIAQFRSNEGKVGAPFEGRPMILISHKGAKSGKVRTTPLVYTTDGDRLVIIASKGGAPTSPDWYHNLKANPDVTIEVGTDKFEARAEEVTGDERRRLYESQAALMPNFTEYQQKTSREIPVIVLHRV
jgi:deazaflavin-dependent oxidoreductase (nitroreductase family)